MKQSGPIIMLPYLDTPAVPEVRPSVSMASTDPFIGRHAVLAVAWSEKHGDSETFILESWVQKAPNIWQAM